MAQLATAKEEGAAAKATSSSGRKPFRLSTLMSILGTTPLIVTAVGVFFICIIYSFVLSFTNSRIFPAFGADNFVGGEQYSRLWSTGRWLISVNNIWFFGLLSIAANMIAGYLLAVFMDQRIKAEDWFRSIFLYPFAMSLVITGLVWRWILDPNYGIQATVRGLGFENFAFAPLVNADTAIYGLVVAGIWNGVGVTMAIMLAGLRGVDAEIWKAAKIDGIPTWRTYLFIVLPMMRGALLTAFILQCVGVVRVYDLIVAMTQGGPGISTQMPAIFVIQHITDRSNVGLGMAAATMMLLPVILLLGLQVFVQWRANRIKESAI